jgi:hypothetical protein
VNEMKKALESGVHSLPAELWPSAESAAWKRPFVPSVRLQRGGAACHFRPVTRRDVETPAFGGMILASFIGIFAVPPLYVKFEAARKQAAAGQPTLGGPDTATRSFLDRRQR